MLAWYSKHSAKLIVIGFPWLFLFIGFSQAASFKVSSIGYHPLGAKTAILEGVTDGKKPDVFLYDPQRRNPKFPVVLGSNTYKVTHMTEITDKSQQGPTSHTYLLDFSDFKEPGNYELRLQGPSFLTQQAAYTPPQTSSTKETKETTPSKTLESANTSESTKSPNNSLSSKTLAPIKINEFLYWDTLKPVMKAFYFQRCGQEVESQSPKMFHSTCHLKDASFLNATHPDGPDTGLDTIGGWHNGGDYNKYVTSTALTAARLMAMDEWNPKPFKFFHIDYPLFEPNYGKIDDLHHEIQAGLDWLMSMQRPDGSLYRKVGGKIWPGKIKPDDDSQPRFLYGVSTQDTAIAAATWAMATRDFKGTDMGYSVKCLLIAEKAWAYLESHPSTYVQVSPSDYAGSGEFLNPDKGSDMPYRVWAAAELYLSTGKSMYHQFFIRHSPDVPLQRFSWMNPALQGAADYLLYARNQDPETSTRLRGSILSLADALSEQVDQSAISSGLERYASSSNADVAENGSLLMLAYRLSGDARYRHSASRLLSYLFGVNPMGMTYVTGLPGKSVQHPVHRWMQTEGKILPGYLVDGPNESPTDGKTPKALSAASYLDQAEARSSNEPKLLNNASLAYLLGLLNESYNATVNPEEAGPKNPLDYELAPERATRKKK